MYITWDGAQQLSRILETLKDLYPGRLCFEDLENLKGSIILAENNINSVWKTLEPIEVPPPIDNPLGL